MECGVFTLAIIHQAVAHCAVHSSPKWSPVHEHAFSSDSWKCTVCIDNTAKFSSLKTRWPQMHCILFIVIKPFQPSYVHFTLPDFWTRFVLLAFFFPFFFLNLAFKEDTHSFLTMSCAFIYLFLILSRHVNCTIGNPAWIRILQVYLHFSQNSFISNNWCGCLKWQLYFHFWPSFLLVCWIAC